MITFETYSNLHTLYSRQIISASNRKAWDFFSNPQNLILITPPEMGIRITSPQEKTITEGQIVTYKINILKFFKVNWVTEITHLKKGITFIDEQRFGPYKFWQHRHIFIQRGNRIEIVDIVSYKLPFGLIGRLMNWLMVERELRKIFDFRYKKIEGLFK